MEVGFQTNSYVNNYSNDSGKRTGGSFHGLDVLGASAPEEVKEAWEKAEKETYVNGLAMNSQGMLTQITKLFVMSVENEYQGRGRDVLGNSVQSAKAAVQKALDRLGVPQNREEKKEEAFYKAFLCALDGGSNSFRVQLSRRIH